LYWRLRNLNVATGEIVAPMLHATRKEEDFVRNIENVIATNPEAGWNFVLDHLNTHANHYFFGGESDCHPQLATFDSSLPAISCPS